MASIKRNFLYSAILTGANYIFPLLVFPYVSRVLGVSNIGICNFANSIIQYFTLFAMMGIGTLGIREIAKYYSNKIKLSRVFSSLFILNAISTLIAVILLVFCILFIERLFEVRELLFIGLFQLIFNFLAIDWYYKGIEDFRYITIRTIIVRLIYVVSVFVFVKDTEDYVLYYLLTSMAVVINACINCIHIRKHVKLILKNIFLKIYVKPFLILGLYAILTSMYTTFNVVYLGFHANDAEVGYYTTAANLFTLILSLFTALTGVVLPRLSMLVAQGKLDEFKKLLSKTTSLLIDFSIPVIIFVEFYSPQIIHVVSGIGYEGAITPMRIIFPLVLIIGFEQILVTQTLLPLQKDKEVLINSIIGAAVGIVGNLILVPIFKEVGASLVWFLSEVAVFISAQIFVYYYISIRVPVRKIFMTLLYNLPLVFCFFLIEKINCDAFFQFVFGVFIFCSYLFIYAFFFKKNNYEFLKFNKLRKFNIK